MGIYFAAALTGSSIAANPDWRQPDEGIKLYVETNGVHVSLIVPMAAGGEDLSDLIRPEDLTDPKLYGTHVMIGWGHKQVYRNARTWADVKSGDIASAIAGSDETTLHVYHLIDPQPTKFRKAFTVSVPQYRLIIRDIRSTFYVINGRGRAYPAYGPDNLFYDSHGRYSALMTCNEWTGSILRRAGIKMGVWTPMPGGVMRWFD